MAGGREYSGGQRKIIKRHYDTVEPRSVQRLQEAVSELYLADSDAAQKRLWKSAETALKNLKIDDARSRKVLAERDLEGLAAMVGEMK